MSVKVRAWIKPLASGEWQYFAKIAGESSVQDRAHNAESAHDAICDYVYGNEAYRNDGDVDWAIDWRTSR